MGGGGKGPGDPDPSGGQRQETDLLLICGELKEEQHKCCESVSFHVFWCHLDRCVSHLSGSNTHTWKPNVHLSGTCRTQLAGKAG